MEELKEGWKGFKLSEFINFNPKETLKKNTVAKYIEMANLQCFSRAISGYEEKEYKGGTKFKNGDTLLARITPCLQNGKTAYINCLEENEIAFGSTEYIVLREKQYISDRKFIYYLAIPNDFNLYQRFGFVISKLMNKIENNRKEIQSLTQIRDTLLPKLMSGEVGV